MTDSNKNLQEAWENFNPTETEYVYRIYYNPVTGESTHTSTELYDEPHIEVDKETYDTFRSALHKIKDGKVINKPVTKSYQLRLKLEESGEFQTIKNRSVFLVDSTYTGATDSWNINYE